MITLQFATSAGFGSKVIRWFTYSDFSHVDVVLPDGTLLGARANGGVKIRPAGYEKFIKTARFVADVPADVEAKIYAFLHAQVGKPYDKTGIVNLVFQKRNWHDDDSWFCSELVAAAFEAAGWPLVVVPDPERVTPRDLTTSTRLRPV